MITTITKRDGRTVHFDINKIASAIEKAFAATIGKKDPIFLKKNKLTPLR